MWHETTHMCHRVSKPKKVASIDIPDERHFRSTYIQEEVEMTEMKKKQLHSRMRRLCRQAIHKLAQDRNLTVLRKDGHHRIVGVDGYISEMPHGEAFHKYFEPGYSSEADWEVLFKRGVVLSYVHTHPPASGDNFWPTNQKEVSALLKSLGITSAGLSPKHA
jgi:hypothetical protein